MRHYSCLLHCCCLVSLVTSFEIYQGQRYLWSPGGSSEQVASNAPRRPLVLIPGFGQRLENWEMHVPNDRPVLVYECAGLGPSTSSRSYDLESQAQTMLSLAADLCSSGARTELDVAGFSLGGRVALAAATLAPIRKLHLTGVALERDEFGQLQLLQWKDHLERNNLRALAWALLSASYTPVYLNKSPERTLAWVEALSKAHSRDELLRLLAATEDVGEWSVASMAERVSTSVTAAHVCCGADDLMAPPRSVQQLGELLGCASPTTIHQAGHAVPFESPKLWRQDMLAFFDHPEL